MTKALPAKTATSHAHLTVEGEFLNIPISIYLAVDDHTRPTTGLFTPDGNRAAQLWIDSVTGEQVERRALVSKHLTEHGPVEVPPEAVLQALDLDAKQLTIHGFYPMALLGTTFKPTHYRTVEPQQTRVGKRTMPNQQASERLTALLRAMAERLVVGLGTLVVRNRPATVVLLPDGQLWEVLTEDQQRADRDEWRVEVTQALIGQMVEMVKSHEDTTPQLVDRYSPATIAFVASQAATDTPAATLRQVS